MPKLPILNEVPVVRDYCLQLGRMHLRFECERRFYEGSVSRLVFIGLIMNDQAFVGLSYNGFSSRDLATRFLDSMTKMHVVALDLMNDLQAS